MQTHKNKPIKTADTNYMSADEKNETERENNYVSRLCCIATNASFRSDSVWEIYIMTTVWDDEMRVNERTQAYTNVYTRESTRIA